MKDALTEMLVGEPGAIRLQGALNLMSVIECKESPVKDRLMVSGVMLGHGDDVLHPMSKGYQEMWHCDIIIIPRRKFSSHNAGHPEPNYYFNGWRMGDIMATQGAESWADPENWGDKYFDSEKGESNA